MHGQSRVERLDRPLQILGAVAPDPPQQHGAQMADLHAGRQDWPAVLDALATGIAAAESLYGQALTDAGKAAEVAANERLYRRLVDACLRQTPPQPVEALLVAEQARSRMLRDRIGMLDGPSRTACRTSCCARRRT